MSKPKKKGDKKDEDPVKLSEFEQKALEILDTSSLKEIITTYKSRVDDLVKDIYDLNDRIKNSNEENLRLTYRMEYDIQDQHEQINKIKNDIQKQREDHESKISELTQQKESSVQSILENRNLEIQERESRISELQTQVVKLQHFEEREVQYLKKMQLLEQQYKQQEYAHQDEMRKLEKNFYKQNQTLETANKSKIEEIMYNAHRIAEKDVKEDEQRTVQENKKLKKDLEVHQDELDYQKKESSSLFVKADNLQKNVNQSIEEIGEYQQMTYQFQQKIKQQKEKIEKLESFAQEEVQKYTQEIELMKYSHSVRVQELEYQNKIIKEQINTKSKDCKNMKAVAQMILDQRSDIEQFFLESLENLRQEIGKKRESEKKPGHKQNTSSKISKIEISELEWEDKEKLLRLLFSKMNVGTSPVPWRDS